MTDDRWLTETFEAKRSHLTAVAYRILGSAPEAEDAVQEAWLRVSRADRSEVENLGGWLTTVVSRICLDMLRSRRARREDLTGDELVELAGADGGDPVHDALLADAVGPALLVVLETLAPAERLAFVLHDMFAVSFEEIATILDRSPAAARQLASRARRRVQGASPPASDPGRQRAIVEAFLAASREGRFDELLAMLSPDVVLRADPVAVGFGASPEVSGAREVAETFSGRARAARLTLIDGRAGAVWSQGGTPRVVFAFTTDGDAITGIELISDPATIGRLTLTPA
jgi:RNA polymerase sigma-70 factor (ECF subfamily)